jgi:hypothetical protein
LLSAGGVRTTQPVPVPRWLAAFLHNPIAQEWPESALNPLTLALAKRTVPMLFAFFEFLDWIEEKMPWLMTWTFMISMAVLAIVLFIVLRVLQNRRPDDD